MYHSILTFLTISQNYGANSSVLKLLIILYQTYTQQSASIARPNSIVLMFLLQFTIFTLTLLSLLYQSTDTSFIMEKPIEKRPQTFNELQEHQVKFHVSELFMKFLVTRHSKEYPEILKSVDNSVDHAEAIERNYAFIFYCDNHEHQFHSEIIKNLYNETTIGDYYMLKERLMPYYQFHDVGRLNPFVERLQHYIDWSYAAGLNQYWDFISTLHYKTNKRSKDENNLLRFADLKNYFVAYSFLLGTCIIVFLLEIFYFYCLRRLKWVRVVLRVVLGRKRLQRPRIRVRRSRVAAMNYEVQ